MHQCSYRFLEVCDLLFRLQFGLGNGRSTDHTLISLTENVQSPLDYDRFGRGIFIDLRKAFDTVNHNILLNYGIKGKSLHWLKSYLNEPMQIVSVNGHSSSLCNKTYRVPQGSVLDLLHFLSYLINLLNSSKLLLCFCLLMMPIFIL